MLLYLEFMLFELFHNKITLTESDEIYKNCLSNFEEERPANERILSENYSGAWGLTYNPSFSLYIFSMAVFASSLKLSL